MDISTLLKFACEQDASDLHISAGETPILRVHGDMKHVSTDVLDAQEDVPEDIKKMAEERLNAKKNKDWATADALRNEIKAKGYSILDSKDGYTIVKD